MSEVNVAVIGGGASGLAAALSAARAGAVVTLYEAEDRVGKKILRTGNGRCNLSNRGVCPAAYNAPDFVAPVLERLPSPALTDWFETLGLWSYADDQGRCYPVSETAASVLDVLRLACAEAGVTVLCGTPVKTVQRRGMGFTLTLAGETRRCDRVVVCTGGGSALLGDLGHSLVPFTPVLCPLKTESSPIRGLDGLRARALVTLTLGDTVLAEEEGEVLFRDYGVSGIVIFNLSRMWKPGAVLHLALLPEIGKETLTARLTARQQTLGHRGREDFFAGLLHSRLAAAVRRAAGGDSPAALTGAIKDISLRVLGPGEAKQAQVTRGGAVTGEFVPETLASRLVPGLYACGETLDVDGRCGGYNLHWAFASGICGGEAAARA